jgi:hypothetical protein
MMNSCTEDRRLQQKPKVEREQITNVNKPKSALKLDLLCESMKNASIVSIHISNIGNAPDSIRYMSCSFAEFIHAKGDTNRLTVFEPYMCGRNAPVSIYLEQGKQILLGRLVTKIHGYCDVISRERICMRILDGRDICN